MSGCVIWLLSGESDLQTCSLQAAANRVSEAEEADSKAYAAAFDYLAQRSFDLPWVVPSVSPPQ